MSDVCAHGQLARQCELCELTAERDEARRANQAMLEGFQTATRECHRLVKQREALVGALLLAEETLAGLVASKRYDREVFADDSEWADWARSRAQHTLGIVSDVLASFK